MEQYLVGELAEVKFLIGDFCVYGQNIKNGVSLLLLHFPTVEKSNIRNSSVGDGIVMENSALGSDHFGCRGKYRNNLMVITTLVTFVWKSCNLLITLSLSTVIMIIM